MSVMGTISMNMEQKNTPGVHVPNMNIDSLTHFPTPYADQAYVCSAISHQLTSAERGTAFFYLGWAAVEIARTNKWH